MPTLRSASNGRPGQLAASLPTEATETSSAAERARLEPRTPRGHFSDWAPWLASMAQHWGLNAPRPAAYLSPFVEAERVRNRCKLVHIDDIAGLIEAVPALREQRAGTYVAFDLDETLIRKAVRHGHERCVAQGGLTLDVLAYVQQHHTCLGLTARPYDHAYDTFFMLDRLGIHFDGMPGQPGPVSTLPNSGNLGGVYYAGHSTPKGALLATLRRDFPDMRHLVFVDDQPMNFVSMVSAIARAPEELKLTCVRYSRFRSDLKHPEAAKEWSEMKEVVWEHKAGKLAALEQEDRSWHQTLDSTPARPKRARVSDHLGRALKEAQPELSKRLEGFMGVVRQRKLLERSALAELEADVAGASAKAR